MKVIQFNWSWTKRSSSNLSGLKWSKSKWSGSKWSNQSAKSKVNKIKMITIKGITFQKIKFKIMKFRVINYNDDSEWSIIMTKLGKIKVIKGGTESQRGRNICWCLGGSQFNLSYLTSYTNTSQIIFWRKKFLNKYLSDT